MTVDLAPRKIAGNREPEVGAQPRDGKIEADNRTGRARLHDGQPEFEDVPSSARTSDPALAKAARIWSRG